MRGFTELYLFIYIGNPKCAEGFIHDPNSHHCFSFSDFASDFDSAIDECTARTQNVGYPADIRTSAVYNFVLENSEGLVLQVILMNQEISRFLIADFERLQSPLL